MARNRKWRSLIVVQIWLTERSIYLSTKKYNPRATENLRYFMLKVFFAILKPAPFYVTMSSSC